MAENEDNIVDVIIEPDPTDPTEELKKGLKSNHFLVIKDSLENGADLRIVYKDAYDSIISFFYMVDCIPIKEN